MFIHAMVSQCQYYSSPAYLLGASFWTDTQQRLDTQNIESHTWTLCANAGSIHHQVAKIHSTVQQLNISCIVGHGLALPLILTYAHQHPTERIILSNGMLTSNVGLIKMVAASNDVYSKHHGKIFCYLLLYLSL